MQVRSNYLVMQVIDLSEKQVKGLEMKESWDFLNVGCQYIGKEKRAEPSRFPRLKDTKERKTGRKQGSAKKKKTYKHHKQLEYYY